MARATDSVVGRAQRQQAYIRAGSAPPFGPELLNRCGLSAHTIGQAHDCGNSVAIMGLLLVVFGTFFVVSEPDDTGVFSVCIGAGIFISFCLLTMLCCGGATRHWYSRCLPREGKWRDMPVVALPPWPMPAEGVPAVAAPAAAPAAAPVGLGVPAVPAAVPAAVTFTDYGAGGAGGAGPSEAV